MDIALLVSLGNSRVDNVHLVKLLCALRAIFIHSSHCCVAVDIGVFTLDIAVLCRFEGKIFIYLHQLCVHLT